MCIFDGNRTDVPNKNSHCVSMELSYLSLSVTHASHG